LWIFSLKQKENEEKKFWGGSVLKAYIHYWEMTFKATLYNKLLSCMIYNAIWLFMDVIKSSRVLRFQDWFVYESSLNSWARIRAKLAIKCVFKLGSFKTQANSSSLRRTFEPSRTKLLDKFSSTRARGKLLNFSMCDQNGVQVRVCEQPSYLLLIT
jgi:hypothetical protein